MKIGDAFHWMGRKVHVVALFTDANEDFVVIKQWFRFKQRWHYDVVAIWLIQEFRANQTRKSSNG